MFTSRALLYDSLVARLTHRDRNDSLDLANVPEMSSDLALLSAVLVGPPEMEIVELETRLRDAQLAADVRALDALIADDLLFAGPDGRLATKRQDLEAHASGVVRFREHVSEELKVRRVGSDVAITSLRARLVVEVAKNVTHGTYRHTRVWAREADATWRVVSKTGPRRAGACGLIDGLPR